MKSRSLKRNQIDIENELFIDAPGKIARRILFCDRLFFRICWSMQDRMSKKEFENARMLTSVNFKSSAVRHIRFPK